MNAAIAAPFAHRLVDEGPAGRVGGQAPLASSPQFGGAGLVVHQDRNPLPPAQFPLQGIHLPAAMEGDVGGEGITCGIPILSFGNHGDTADPFGAQLAGNHGNAQRPVHGLAAGHGDGVVIENLVSNVHAGGDGGAHGQQAGMEISAVPQVDERMFRLGERRLADPAGPFATHVGEGLGVPVHPRHHVVASDAGQRPRPFGNLGGRVVGTAGTEIGDPLDIGQGALHHLFPPFQNLQPLLDAGAGVKAVNAFGDHPGDAGRGQFAGRRQDPGSFLVELAHHPGAHAGPPVVQLLLHLVFDDGALFLHHQDFFQPFGEMAHAFPFQGPGHAHLVNPKADFGGLGFVDTQILQGLEHVEERFAGGDNAQPRPGAVDDHGVEAVGPGESQRGVDLVLLQAPFLIQGWIGPADVKPAFGHFEITGQGDGDAVRVNLNGGRGVHVFGDRLHAYPAAGIPRHGPADDAEIQDFLHVGRIEHRDLGVGEGVFALAGHGG